MSMVCGLDLHRQQITFDALTPESGEVWRGRVWQPDRQRFRRWLTHDVARRADGHRWRWRWRAVPAGATWPRRSKRPGSRRTSPSRPTRRRRVAASIEPRPTGPTLSCCASCCSMASCPSRGSRRRSCWSGANGPAVQVAGRSTQGVDPTDPCRVVPARRRRAGGPDPHTIDASVAGQQRGDVDCVGPAADRGRLLDDRRHRQRGAAAQGATAALRDAPAGLPGAGRASLRDRRPARR